MIFKGNAPEVKPEPKTKAGNRVVPIPNALYVVLSDYLNSIDTFYLFARPDGSPLTGCKQLINNDITAYIFRHTFATMLYIAGVDVKEAQRILGHSSIRVTMDINTHLDSGNNPATLNKLNDSLDNNLLSEKKQIES